MTNPSDKDMNIIGCSTSEPFSSNIYYIYPLRRFIL